MIEGKTKRLTPLWRGADIAVVTTKDDITAGDGAKHDVMIGKAELSTRTTCNIFEYLRKRGVPVAYVGRDGPTTFLTKMCTMIPVEVVVRSIATGSYLKRNPEVSEGTALRRPVVEYFYKTTGRKLGGMVLPCDDPLMRWNSANGVFELFLPNKPLSEGYIGPLLSVDRNLSRHLNQCASFAFEVNRHLLDAWETLEGKLYDFKVEFGILPSGAVVLADVLDCDSWRVMWCGIQLSKQGYRDGDDLESVLGIYRLAASLTDRLV